MPVREVTTSFSADHRALVRELAAEWSKPNESNSEPLINVERDALQNIVHVYVVWTKWASIDRIERSEIIMEAAQVALTPLAAVNITIAMGLTPEEAPVMGFQFGGFGF